MSDTQGALVLAVQQLTQETRKLHSLLESDYPKRGEVERKYVSKFQQQKLVIRLLLSAILFTVLSFVGTIGSFSVCLVGDDNPGICGIVPGFDERVTRRNEVDNKNMRQDREIERLLRKQGLNPINPPTGGGNG